MVAPMGADLAEQPPKPKGPPKMRSFAEIIDTVLYTGFGTFVALLLFMAFASKQARDNPLRVVLGALATRIVATIGITMIDIPLSAFEPVGGVIDAASLGLVAYYWWTGIRQMLRAFDQSEPQTGAAKPHTDLTMLPKRGGD